MANEVEYVLRAKDDASAVVTNLLRRFESLDGMLSKISSIGAVAGPIGAITTSLIASATAAYASGKAMADYVEQLDRSVASTGITATNLQVMRRVIQDGGGDVEGLTTALVKFNGALQDEDPLLAKIGVTSKDPFTAFMQLARAISSSTDAKARDAVASRLLGRAGADLVADLRNLVEGFDSTNESMRRTGLLIDESLADKIRALDIQMDALSRNWDGAMTRMKTVSIPIASAIASAFNDMWDAISGADKAPGLSDIDRKLSEIDDKIRRRLKQDNDAAAGKLVSLFGFVNESLTELMEVQRGLLADRDRLTGGRDAADRARRLHDGTSSRDTLGADFKSIDKSGAHSKSEKSPLLTFGMGPDTAAESYMKKLRGGDFSNIDATIASLAGTADQAGKSFETLEHYMQRVTEQLTPLDVAFQRMSQSAVANIDAAANAVAWGAVRIDLFFQTLMDSILRDMEAAAIKMGIGIGLSALSAIPGLGWLAPIGAAVTGTPGKAGGSGHTAMAPAGGNTFNISTLNAKGLIEEIVSPSGQLRQANDRIRDVARAGAL